MTRGDRWALALFIFVSALIGAAIYFLIPPPTAAADGYLDDQEADYAARWAPDICNALDNRSTAIGVVRVAQEIIGDGYPPDSAVDIINASVMVECPRHWPLLVAVGRAARESQGPLT